MKYSQIYFTGTALLSRKQNTILPASAAAVAAATAAAADVAELLSSRRLVWLSTLLQEGIIN